MTTVASAGPSGSASTSASTSAQAQAQAQDRPSTEQQPQPQQQPQPPTQYDFTRRMTPQQHRAMRAALDELVRGASDDIPRHDLPRVGDEAHLAALGQQNNAALRALLAENNDALRVRRNFFAASLSAIRDMNRIRKFLLGLRLFLAIAQLAVGLTIVSLNSSHGDSAGAGYDPFKPFQDPSQPICRPSAMLVFLSLHITRVAINLPVDLYLSLSPHRSNRARRPGAEGLQARERTRAIGSLMLDRRIAKVSDFLALAHVVLFIVGNYTLYSSSECAKAPSRSVPLFWTTFAFLAIDYLSIVEITLLALAVIFFLPVVIFLLRLFGIADRFGAGEIRPEHKKISQETVDDQIPLVFYRPAEEEEEGKKNITADNTVSLEEAAGIPLPPSGAQTPLASPPLSPRKPRSLMRDQSFTARSQRSVSASVRSIGSASNLNTSNSPNTPPAASTSANTLAGAVRRQGPLSRLLFARQASSSSIRPAASRQASISSAAQREQGGEEGIALNVLGASNQAGADTDSKGSGQGAALKSSARDEEADQILPLAPATPGKGPGGEADPLATGNSAQGQPYEGGVRRYPLPYPLHPLTANRATCPICLSDYIEPPDMEPAKWAALERRRIKTAEAAKAEEEANKKRKEEEESPRQGETGEAPATGEVTQGTETAPAHASSASAPSSSRPTSRFFGFVRSTRSSQQNAQTASSGSASPLAADSPTGPEETIEERDARLLSEIEDLDSEAFEPLRLMKCGHVLHRSCLDEWLTGVSGRCPVCSRPVLKTDDEEGKEEEGGAGAAAQARGEGAA
ncbi:hypothetical protein OC846_002214 [Tilletia horrida]|uniref:RING-type domain-containing protein n=1 Tax=Tilletia horrida TaxID=155126 RepID=A0AAN6GRA1_9BASI|nr:hypothetical protein OC846_002214 [Tilletia horrida]KAK0568995.1 hypothetical protein OC861_001432 [Tilletia horrida]